MRTSADWWLLACALFVASSAIVLALLRRRTSESAVAGGSGAVRDVLGTVGILLLSIVVLVCAGLGLLFLSL